MVRAYGPGGTIGLGGGCDLTLLALDLFLQGVGIDPATWAGRPEAKAFAHEQLPRLGNGHQGRLGTSDEDITAAIAFGVQHFAPKIHS